MRARPFALLLAALLVLPPGAAMAASDEQTSPLSTACVSGDASQAGTQLFGSGTEVAGTSRVGGLVTVLVMEPYIAPGTRHRLIAVPGGWCDAEAGFNQAWKANGFSNRNGAAMAETYARLAAAPYFDQTTVTSRSSIAGVHTLTTHALTNGVEAKWTIITDPAGVRSATWAQTAFAVKPFVAQWEGMTALDGAKERYTRLADGLLIAVRGLPKNETDEPAAEVSYTHPVDNFKIVVGIGDSRNAVDVGTDSNVSRVDVLRQFKRAVQENYEDFYGWGFRANWARAVTRFLVLQANGLSIAPERTGYVSINDSTSAYCQACVFIADDFQIHMVSEFRVFLEALGYTYPGASDFEVLSDILGHEMFHNWQNNYVKQAIGTTPGSYSEGTARFQETLHYHSAASHQPDSLVYAADANGCNGFVPNDSSMAGGAFQTPAYSACNFWLPWYGTYGIDALAKLIIEGAPAGAATPGANASGKVIKAIEVATGESYARSAAVWAAGLITGENMEWDPPVGAGPTLDWGLYLRRWIPGTLESGASATASLANGGLMARRVNGAFTATVTSGAVLAVLRDSSAGYELTYPAAGEAIPGPATDEKLYVIAINPVAAPLLTTIGVQGTEAPQPAGDPVATTLFLDGAAQVGEAEGVNAYLDLVPTAGAAEKSMQLVNYVGGPNTNCAGNTLFPVFLGNLSGTVTGDITVTFDALASGGSVDVRVWPDVSSQLCNAPLYPAPARSKIVALPAGGRGTVTATLSGADFEAGSVLMVQITPVTTTPFAGRVYYGTASAKVDFSCIPAFGSTACI